MSGSYKIIECDTWIKKKVLLYLKKKTQPWPNQRGKFHVKISKLIQHTNFGSIADDNFYTYQLLQRTVAYGTPTVWWHTHGQVYVNSKRQFSQHVFKLICEWLKEYWINLNEISYHIAFMQLLFLSKAVMII